MSDARYGVVSSHYQLEQYPQFLTEAKTFIQDFPQHSLSESLLWQMAEYYQKDSQLDEAIATYAYAVEQYADRPLADKARFRLGELYLAASRPREAITVFAHVIEQGQDPSLKPDALFGQAQAFEAESAWPEAAASYTQIAEAYPDSPLAARGLFQAGLVWQRQLNYEKAGRLFETVIERYPKAPIRYESWLQLGIVRLAMKTPQTALDVLSKASETPDKGIASQAVWHSGRAHTAAGDLQKGINAYLRVAYLYPEAKALVPEALREAARNYTALNKCPEALKVYDKLRQQDVSAKLKQDVAQEIARSGCQS